MPWQIHIFLFSSIINSLVQSADFRASTFLIPKCAAQVASLTSLLSYPKHFNWNHFSSPPLSPPTSPANATWYFSPKHDRSINYNQTGALPPPPLRCHFKPSCTAASLMAAPVKDGHPQISIKKQTRRTKLVYEVDHFFKKMLFQLGDPYTAVLFWF